MWNPTHPAGLARVATAAYRTDEHGTLSRCTACVRMLQSLQLEETPADVYKETAAVEDSSFIMPDEDMEEYEQECLQQEADAKEEIERTSVAAGGAAAAAASVVVAAMPSLATVQEVTITQPSSLMSPAVVALRESNSNGADVCTMCRRWILLDTPHQHCRGCDKLHATYPSDIPPVRVCAQCVSNFALRIKTPALRQLQTLLDTSVQLYTHQRRCAMLVESGACLVGTAHDMSEQRHELQWAHGVPNDASLESAYADALDPVATPLSDRVASEQLLLKVAKHIESEKRERNRKKRIRDASQDRTSKSQRTAQVSHGCACALTPHSCTRRRRTRDDE